MSRIKKISALALSAALLVSTNARAGELLPNNTVPGAHSDVQRELAIHTAQQTVTRAQSAGRTRQSTNQQMAAASAAAAAATSVAAAATAEAYR